jgi:hypothetical protein
MQSHARRLPLVRSRGPGAHLLTFVLVDDVAGIAVILLACPVAAATWGGRRNHSVCPASNRTLELTPAIGQSTPTCTRLAPAVISRRQLLRIAVVVLERAGACVV